MPESVYKVIELVGTSTESWEKAAKAAVDRAAKSLRDLRIAEVVQQDMMLKNGKVEAYRAKVKVSFKFEGKGCRPARGVGTASSAQKGGDGRDTVVHRNARRRFWFEFCRMHIDQQPLYLERTAACSACAGTKCRTAAVRRAAD